MLTRSRGGLLVPGSLHRTLTICRRTADVSEIGALAVPDLGGTVMVRCVVKTARAQLCTQGVICFDLVFCEGSQEDGLEGKQKASSADATRLEQHHKQVNIFRAETHTRRSDRPIRLGTRLPNTVVVYCSSPIPASSLRPRDVDKTGATYTTLIAAILSRPSGLDTHSVSHLSSLAQVNGIQYEYSTYHLDR